jgi:4-hydroxybenzoate polyprenyltransferase
MMRLSQFLVLALAIVAGVFAIRGHRQAPNTATRWGTRTSLVLSLGMICGTAPAAFAPTVLWLRWTVMISSLVLTAVSFYLLRRLRRDRVR